MYTYSIQNWGYEFVHIFLQKDTQRRGKGAWKSFRISRTKSKNHFIASPYLASKHFMQQKRIKFVLIIHLLSNFFLYEVLQLCRREYTFLVCSENEYVCVCVCVLVRARACLRLSIFIFIFFGERYDRLRFFF